MSKEHEATPISKLVLNHPVYRQIAAWQEAAGPALLKEVEFQGIQVVGSERWLRLRVKDAAWRAELEYQREEILNRYRRAFKNLGAFDYELPTDCSLGASTSLPVKAVNAQNSRNKRRINR